MRDFTIGYEWGNEGSYKGYVWKVNQIIESKVWIKCLFIEAIQTLTSLSSLTFFFATVGGWRFAAATITRLLSAFKGWRTTPRDQCLPNAQSSSAMFQTQNREASGSAALRIINMTDSEVIGKLLLLDWAVVVDAWIYPEVTAVA